jgi:hypothetical protein
VPGEQRFAELPASEQIKILGPSKWAAWKDGKVTFDRDPISGIVGQTDDPRWGRMHYERSLKAIVGKEKARAYYPASGRRTGGFTWFEGELIDVESAIQLGESEMGWIYHEAILRRDYLPRFNLVDDVEHTLGLWNTPEPSFNAYVMGKTADVVAFARTWGRDYNQDAMAILLPTQKGDGGVLAWDFGRKLSTWEMNSLLSEVKKVNDALGTMKDIPVSIVGLTVKDYRRIEFWVNSKVEKIFGEDLLRNAIRRSGLTLPDTLWQDGYKLVFIGRNDY